nr:sigma-54-dependent Fis family transcriptional regulator [Bacteroidota bacterium]
MNKIIASILIVDDNEEVLIALKMYLSKYFLTVHTEKNQNLITARLLLNDYDVIILDMNFSAGVNTGNEGIFWMKKIHSYSPGAMIIMLTAYGDVELAVKAMKEGGADFIQKPWDNEKLLATVRNVVSLGNSKKKIDRLKAKQQHLSENISSQYDFFMGPSPAMKKVMNTVDKIAGTDANILILGENGTGKELIAREIHRRSARSKEVFVNVDLGAITDSLFESELFGHEKGAFTDAKESRAGRFEIASGGTLFLDEIGNLKLPMQSKLLAALQNREVYRLGSVKPTPVDIRLVSATNMQLREMVKQHLFREDLLYRINTIMIEVPPLRNRMEDIPQMLDYFLEKYTKKYQLPPFKIRQDAISKLKKYDWPGNIREFEHMVEKAVILSDTDQLTQNDFSFQQDEENDLVLQGDYNLDDNEKVLIRRALQDFNFNLSETATQLGITRATLYRKIKKYEI